MPLEKEMQYYDSHSAEWMKTHNGEYVVLKGDSVLGFYKTEDDALAAGATEYGATPYLVRKVGEPPQEFSAPALALGILRAYP